MKNPVIWFEILAAPGAKSELQQFYASTFGWEYDDADGGYAMVRRAEDARGIGGAVDEGESEASVVISIEVDDLPAYLEKIKANGGEVVRDITVIPGMVTFATFRDPAGNVLGVVDAKVPPAE